MEISDLLPIARLEKLVDNKYIVLKPYKNFQPEFLKIENIFLFFPDNSVRIVQLDEIINSKDSYKISFKNNGILNELGQISKIQLMIPVEDYEELTLDEEIRQLLDCRVYFNNEYIGEVTDVMDNSAHKILIIENSECDKEYLIPYVDYYTQSVDFKDKKIFVRNADDLLEL